MTILNSAILNSAIYGMVKTGTQRSYKVHSKRVGTIFGSIQSSSTNRDRQLLKNNLSLIKHQRIELCNSTLQKGGSSILNDDTEKKNQNHHQFPLLQSYTEYLQCVVQKQQEGRYQSTSSIQVILLAQFFHLGTSKTKFT